MPSNVDYDPYLGVNKVFNNQGKQSIKCNTGWVDENYFELIQDLLLSETILLGNKPVTIKSKSMDKKTYIKDKNINYTIDFQYAFGLINDIM
jgi:type IV secretory pathway VirB10-like protein